MTDSRILLVDDEQPILDLLSIALRKDGFECVDTATNGAEAISKCRSWRPDLVILDVMLPDMNGLDVCHHIRTFSNAPILFLTAKSSDYDKLMGFGHGGDDYVTKPFNPLEIVARARAHLRRQNAEEIPASSSVHTFDMGRFQLKESSAELFVDGTPVPCPAREFQLLLFFCQHPNHVFSRNQLYEAVWGETSMGDDNTVMVHIRRLREKIEPNPAHPTILVTVRGLGYKLACTERGAANA